MDTSKQNTNIIENNYKIGAKNLWKSVESEYQVKLLYFKQYEFISKFFLTVYFVSSMLRFFLLNQMKLVSFLKK